MKHYKIIKSIEGEQPNTSFFVGDFLGIKKLIQDTIKREDPIMLNVLMEGEPIFYYHGIRKY